MIEANLLAPLPFFHHLSRPACEALAARAVRRRLGRGEVLFVAGTPLTGMFVILEGRVRVLNQRNGRQHLVHEEGPGGTLGEVPLLDGGPCPATAMAAEPTVVVRLGRDALEAALRADPASAFVFLGRLAARVRVLVDRLDRVATLDVTSRLARALLDRLDGGGTVGISQTELAEELGTVREVVVRALRGLRTRGAVRSGGRGVLVVTDRRELLRIAGDR
jgi:CRP/FNR family cyclic AMP-dependent transcriptional regulator